MSDLRNLTRDFLRQFIALYRAQPCLWKTKSKDYTDKNKKNAAYKILLENLKTVQPEATKNTVIQKINSLRSGFRRELKKVKDSKRSGTGADEVYVPALWYYELMEFVSDQEIPRDSVSNIPQDNSPAGESQSEHADDEISKVGSDIEVDNEDSVEATDVSNSEHTILSPVPSTSTCGSSKSARKKRKAQTQSRVNKADEILNIVGERLNNTSEDEFSIIGKNVATKLRRMPRETKIYTEKLINDLLFKADLGQINQYTIISTSTPTPAVTGNTISTFNYPQSNIDLTRNLAAEYPTLCLENSNYPNSDSSVSDFYSRFKPQ